MKKGKWRRKDEWDLMIGCSGDLVINVQSRSRKSSNHPITRSLNQPRLIDPKTHKDFLLWNGLFRN